MKVDFRDQIVIVTGASSGVGRSLALLLEVRGVKVGTASAWIDMPVRLKYLKG